MTVRVFTPEYLYLPVVGEVRVFLGGTIDLGNSEDWQSAFINDIRERVSAGTNVALFNPRRETWYGEPVTDNPEFVRQVEWEMSNLDAADIIVMVLLGSSKSPVSLMELGLHARTSSMVVYCEDGFWRKGNVDMVCERYGVRQVNTYGELLDAVLERINV